MHLPMRDGLRGIAGLVAVHLTQRVTMSLTRSVPADGHKDFSVELGIMSRAGRFRKQLLCLLCGPRGGSIHPYLDFRSQGDS